MMRDKIPIKSNPLSDHFLYLYPLIYSFRLIKIIMININKRIPIAIFIILLEASAIFPKPQSIINKANRLTKTAWLLFSGCCHL